MNDNDIDNEIYGEEPHHCPVEEEMRKEEEKKPSHICSACGIEVIFNLHIYKITGLCGTCSTGEARLNYEEY